MGYIPQVQKDPVILRSAATAIGTSYDASPTPLPLQNWNQAVIFFDLTLDTATAVTLKIEVATPAGNAIPVAGDWYQLAYSDTANATAATGTETVPLRAALFQMLTTQKLAYAVPVNYKWMRVSAKTTGGPGATTLAIQASQGLV